MFPNFTFFIGIWTDPGQLGMQEMEQELADLEALESAARDSNLPGVRL